MNYKTNRKMIESGNRETGRSNRKMVKTDS